MFQVWSPQQLEWMMREQNGSFVLIDLRQPQQYAQGHFPGAVNLPLSLETGELEWEQKDWAASQGRLLVFYCEHGGKSMHVARSLGRRGVPTASLGFGWSQYRGRSGGRWR